MLFSPTEISAAVAMTAAFVFSRAPLNISLILGALPNPSVWCNTIDRNSSLFVYIGRTISAASGDIIAGGAGVGAGGTYSMTVFAVCVSVNSPVVLGKYFETISLSRLSAVPAAAVLNWVFITSFPIWNSE